VGAFLAFGAAAGVVEVGTQVDEVGVGVGERLPDGVRVPLVSTWENLTKIMRV
jgi:hypothetical protein